MTQINKVVKTYIDRFEGLMTDFIGDIRQAIDNEHRAIDIKANNNYLSRLIQQRVLAASNQSMV